MTIYETYCKETFDVINYDNNYYYKLNNNYCIKFYNYFAELYLISDNILSPVSLLKNCQIRPYINFYIDDMIDNYSYYCTTLDEFIDILNIIRVFSL